MILSVIVDSMIIRCGHPVLRRKFSTICDGTARYTNHRSIPPQRIPQDFVGRLSGREDAFRICSRDTRECGSESTRTSCSNDCRYAASTVISARCKTGYHRVVYDYCVYSMAPFCLRESHDSRVDSRKQGRRLLNEATEISRSFLQLSTERSVL